jgi:membrane associated rhomboid family serine protease
VSFEALEGPRGVFPLRGGRAIELRSDGISHPRSPWGGLQIFTPYEDVTHLAVSRHVLRLGTEPSVYWFARRSFDDPAAPERIASALHAVLSHRPGGDAQLARMAAIDAAAHRRAAPLATLLFAAGCAAAFGLARALGFEVFEAGQFSPLLVADGDLWRATTYALLHHDRAHLLQNLVPLLPLGLLLERALGTSRTACVMLAAAVGGACLAGLVGPSPLIGSSAVVFGLAGALLFVDINRAREIPASARVPRLWLVVLLLFLALDLVPRPGADPLGPARSVAAHAGGLVGGIAAALLAARPGARLAAARGPSPAGGVAAALWLLSLAAAGLALASGHFLERHATRLVSLPGASPHELNDLAWRIAIAPGSTRPELEAALAAAERAVDETGRREAAVLDTLAELHFLLGRPELAVGAIDEAIAREPEEPYYREQRRRFTGERPAADRPPEPAPFAPPAAREPEPPAGEPGITV